jgi:Sec7-like guanine-nucleotide exchange factor
MNIEEAFRLFFSTFRAHAESQIIERCLTEFSNKYYADNKATTLFINTSAVLTFAYSIMILQTDLHNPVLKVNF